MYSNKAPNDTLLKSHLVLGTSSIYSSNCFDGLLQFLLFLCCMLHLSENNQEEVRQKADYLFHTIEEVFSNF